jgi:D-xylose transport system permease protein
VSLFGGSGSVIKSVAGVFILYSLSNGFNMLNIGANYQQLIQGAIIVGSAAIYTVAEQRNRVARGKQGESAALVITDAREVANQASAGQPAHATKKGEPDV